MRHNRPDIPENRTSWDMYTQRDYTGIFVLFLLSDVQFVNADFVALLERA
jgi:hypothetical protein